MVTILLIVIPPSITIILFLLSTLGLFPIFASGSFIPILHFIFTALALFSSLAAAFRNRKNLRIMSAWLFLFVGFSLLILSGIFTTIDKEYSLVSQITLTVAVLPLIIFAWFLAMPLRVLITQRKRRIWYNIFIFLILLGVVLGVFISFIRSYGPDSSTMQLLVLKALRPLLDIFIVFPVGLIVFILGTRRGNRAYLLISLGFFMSIFADLESYYLALTQYHLHDKLVLLLGLCELTYFSLGGLTAAFEKESDASPDTPTLTPVSFREG